MAEQVVSVESIQTWVQMLVLALMCFFFPPQGGFTGTDEDTSNLKEAQQFIEKNVAVFQASRPES